MQGMWTDFGAADGTPEHGGGLLDLWMVNRGMSFRDALKDVAHAFQLPEGEDGWERKGGERKEPRAPTQGDLLARLRAPVKDGAVWKWLTEKRKITPAAIAQYRVGEYTGKWRDGKEHDFVVFPYFDEEGKLVLLKYRDVAEKKNMWTWPRLADGGKVILFGLQALRVETETGKVQWPKDLLITEGELDAMALGVYGYPAVSLPFGAQGKKTTEVQDGDGPVHLSKAHEKWIENMHEWLEGFEAIYLAGDGDEAGRAAWTGIPQRLGEYRIRYVTWPDGHKDANECLQFGTHEKQIYRAIMDAKNCDPVELVRAESMRELIRNEYWPKDGKAEGDELPWAFPFLFRPGQATVWHGWKGSGKTMLIYNCLAWWAATKDRYSCLTGLEWLPHETWGLLGRIGMGKRKPHGEAEFNETMTWLNEFFILYHSIRTTALEDILRVWRYAAMKYGCFHFVLDALLRVKGAKVEDLDCQREIMNELLNFADEFRVHVHLVAHSKKPDARHDPRRTWPSAYDISGSSDIANLAHNVICVWRNTGKEEALFEANLMDAGDPDRAAAETAWTKREDTLLVVQKQRKTGQEGHKRLWFDKEGDTGSFQFRDAQGAGRGVRMIGGKDEGGRRKPEGEESNYETREMREKGE
jgi:twinkle protein